MMLLPTLLRSHKGTTRSVTGGGAAALLYPVVANSRIWLDRNRNVYSDTAGTVPAAVNDSIAAWRAVGEAGWGGTNIIASQSTSSRRPVLKSDGIQSDGVDDRLTCSLLINGNYTMYFVVSKANSSVTCGMADYNIYGYFGGGNNLFCSNGASWHNATNWNNDTSKLIVRFRSGGGQLKSKVDGYVEQTFTVAAANATLIYLTTANGGGSNTSTSRFMQFVLVDKLITPGDADDLAIITKLQALEPGAKAP